MKSNQGANRLARSIMQRISDQTSGPSSIELGTIQSDMGLRLDRFAVAIPQGDYLVCRNLLLPDPVATTNEVTVGDHGVHSHTVGLPTKMAPLAAGDRVLVVWAHDQEPVVVDVVT